MENSNNSLATRTKRKPRWYFGGIAGTTAATVTHPFDLIKVALQTTKIKKLTAIGAVKQVISQNDGRFLALYTGVTASMLRQSVYTTTRFGVYELGKPYIKTDHFLGKITLAATAGVIGGVVGTPTDVVNVRMQSDSKLEPKYRRNYKHALDGLKRIYMEEGIRGLYTGATVVSTRAIFTTIGQLAFYEQIKGLVMSTEKFKDVMFTHFLVSLLSSAMSTCIIIPFDVIKTTAMNSKPNEYSGILEIIIKVAKKGPFAFYKGFTPAFIRGAPHTAILFMTFEQLRLHCGIDPTDS